MFSIITRSIELLERQKFILVQHKTISLFYRDKYAALSLYYVTRQNTLALFIFGDTKTKMKQRDKENSSVFL